jgi:hypothetical protein
MTVPHGSSVGDTLFQHRLLEHLQVMTRLIVGGFHYEDALDYIHFLGQLLAITVHNIPIDL